MRICLDLSPAVHHRAGIGRYARELFLALLNVAPEHEYVAFFNRSAEAGLASLEHAPVLARPWRDKPWRLRVLLAYLMHAAQDRLFPNVELFHGTDHLLPYFGYIPSVFTLYDLTFLLTETHATLNRLYMQLMTPRFLHHADAITVISDSTRRDVLHHYALDEHKVHVIYPGKASHFRPASPEAITRVCIDYKLPKNFILAVGTIEPRKNFITLLRAYHQVRQTMPEVGLVIVGKRGWRSEPFYAELHSLGLENQVIFLGFVADADLPAIYSAAWVLAYPSLYEGFGFPPLEAMACGTPVVCSNTSSLPEVVGDAGILLPPNDVHSWIEALKRLVQDTGLCADLRRRGFRQSARFSWEETARQTLEVYRKVYAPHP